MLVPPVTQICLLAACYSGGSPRRSPAPDAMSRTYFRAIGSVGEHAARLLWPDAGSSLPPRQVLCRRRSSDTLPSRISAAAIYRTAEAAVILVASSRPNPCARATVISRCLLGIPRRQRDRRGRGPAWRARPRAALVPVAGAISSSPMLRRQGLSVNILANMNGSPILPVIEPAQPYAPYDRGRTGDADDLNE